MIVVVGGISFGLVIGYLAWYAVRPGSTEIDLKTVSAFIGVIGGAAITALFPVGSEMFFAYCIGVSLGFFFTPLWRFTEEKLITFSEQQKENQRTQQAKEDAEKKRREEALQEELVAIDSNWTVIERLVNHRKMMYPIISTDQLAELPYSITAKHIIMQMYARRHIKEGVEYKRVYTDYKLHYPKGTDAPTINTKTAQKLEDASMPVGVRNILQVTPIARFETTYVYGNDTYDVSFSIENIEGDFLGECGVGSSEALGTDTPKRVTAFEVWLFDKNDIRTVTKVWASDHYFFNEATKAILAAKGEPYLAKPHETIVLETATLIVNADITEMEYGSGALSPRCYFERLTVELSAWAKESSNEENNAYGQ